MEGTTHLTGGASTSVLYRALLSRVGGPGDSSGTGTNDRGGFMCAFGGEPNWIRQANGLQDTDTGGHCMRMDTGTPKELDGVVKDSPSRTTTADNGATHKWWDRG